MIYFSLYPVIDLYLALALFILWIQLFSLIGVTNLNKDTIFSNASIGNRIISFFKNESVLLFWRVDYSSSLNIFYQSLSLDNISFTLDETPF